MFNQLIVRRDVLDDEQVKRGSGEGRLNMAGK